LSIPSGIGADPSIVGDLAHCREDRTTRQTTVVLVAAAQNESSLCQEGNFEGSEARQISPPSRDATG